jgi:hypothetical protein
MQVHLFNNKKRDLVRRRAGGSNTRLQNLGTNVTNGADGLVPVGLDRPARRASSGNADTKSAPPQPQRSLLYGSVILWYWQQLLMVCEKRNLTGPGT